ncbi:MAG TPA: glycosyltransferase family 4 protein [Symbiobacteriaceae bacterium]|jgi:glycosyltransferase involved in cell wall biosynthesis
MPRARVAVVYKSLPQYRRRFFELLRERLARDNIEFELIYGQAGARDASKKDLVDLPWATRIQNRIVRVGARDIYWQPCLRQVQGADLVILEQASKLLVNYVLLAQQLLGLRKVAFWGHGKNFQSGTASPLGEWIKRWVSRTPRWWFVYNELSAGVVRSLGYPPGRITPVQNAIDTRELVTVAGNLKAEDLEALRTQLAIRGHNVAVYCGGMYREKCLDFLLEASIMVRALVPDFELVLIGAGPEQSKVEEAMRTYNWIHYVGPKFDTTRVPYFGLAKLCLMPGLVGLGILDSFALGTPLVTTDVDFHSPEIDYLIQDQNGVMTPHDPEVYAEEVAALLRDESRRARLVAGCRQASQKYTVEEMVERFALGVIQALTE